MRFLPFSLLLLLHYSVSVLFAIERIYVFGQCLEDEGSLLLQLKGSLSFNLPTYVTSNHTFWNQTNTDCCSWDGVTCNDSTGHVIGLNLSSKFISGGIDNLFSLGYLKSLDLSNNTFNSSRIPSGLGQLIRLTNLNLSNSGFGGQVPIEITRLTRLVSLDLSSQSPGRTLLKLEDPDFKTFVEKLSGLRILRLDGVNISAQGSDWCQALSSALPNLKMLSLSNCYLLGPLSSSLSNLSSLSEIRLDQNNISQEVPQFFVNFSNLTSLSLRSCGLRGKFPEKILLLPTLETLDVSINPLLNGSVPEFSHNGSLRNLVLSVTNFSGNLPKSIGNLKLLSKLDLMRCNFNGSIPSSILNLTQLAYLDLSANSFTGPIPSLPENLIQINLAYNKLSGKLLAVHWERFLKLVNLDLRNNSLKGSIPSSLFTLPSLQKLQLSHNQFVDQLSELSNVSSAAPLDTLDLSSNKLEGQIPKSIFEFRGLKILTLSFNNFGGTVQLELIRILQNLTSLDLSYNSLSVTTTVSHSTSLTFPNFTTLKLASCKLRDFPDFLRKNQKTLSYLDLSNNQIHGKVPSWIWKISNESLAYLNLSCNFLTDLERPLPDFTNSSLAILDLHSNLLQGKIPILSATPIYLDYSNNNFTTITPTNISRFLSFTVFFSLSSNKLTGEIPSLICNATYLQVLDLSNNSLSGTIPQCLVNTSTRLRVLNLRRNNFTGTLPHEFPDGCALRTLNLNWNRLEGRVPITLANCTKLEVLDLGNNRINDTFPSFLGKLSQLRVLVLRSNKFYGPIKDPENNYTFGMLQIVDLSSNYFTGILPSKCLLSWKAMMVHEDETQSKSKHGILRHGFLPFSQGYYQDAVTVTSKGLQMELVKILTVFTFIDLSHNNLSETIPDEIGKLTSLYVLNMSGNALTGEIPKSVGNLRQLESLDLSKNKLNGEIPLQLVNLTFLSVLNLSQNNLVGRIPTGNQFLTFTNTSFEGNVGLCGLPLSKRCTEAKAPPPTLTVSLNSVSEFDWKFILTGVGFGGGAGMVVGPLMLWKKGKKWYDEHMDRILLMIVPSAGLLYTNHDNKVVEPEDTMEEDDDEEEEDNEEIHHGRFCLFCSMLDISRKNIVHNPNCSCHNMSPPNIFSSPL